MKKFTLAIVITFFSLTFANAQTYSLNVLSGTYTDLQNPTSLTQGMLWDDPEFQIPLGFNFPVLGSVLDSLWVFDSYVAPDYDEDTIISPHGADVIDRGDLTGTSQSSINYKVEGAPGSRILKIEWKNVGYYDEMDSLGTLNYFCNYQMWIYENGTFEVRYGSSSIPDPMIAFYYDPGPAIGFGTYAYSFWLQGNPANPTLVPMVMDYATLSGVPADGTIYQFAPSGIGIDKPAENISISTYPNPVQNSLTIESNEAATAELFNISGEKVVSAQITAGTSAIDVAALSSGVYMLRVVGESGQIYTEKILK